MVFALSWLVFGCLGPANDDGADTTAQSTAPPVNDAAGDDHVDAVASSETACPADIFAMTLTAPSDVAAPPSDTERTESGLASRLLRCGTGSGHPRGSDEVTVNYVGWTTDGQKFDSSLERGEPATFPLDFVIEGWKEGLQLMKLGEMRRFWIPEDLAYGGRAGAPAGMLVFDVELIDIVR